MNLVVAAVVVQAHLADVVGPEGVEKAGRLWVRTPDWLPPEELAAGRVDQAGGALGLLRIAPWAVTDPLPAGAEVRVRFRPVRRVEEEWSYWQRYRMAFEGDTLVEMSPRGRHAPMFPALRSPAERTR